MEEPTSWQSPFLKSDHEFGLPRVGPQRQLLPINQNQGPVTLWARPSAAMASFTLPDLREHPSTRCRLPGWEAHSAFLGVTEL